MKRIEGLGGGDVQVWAEDGFVMIGVAPHGANRYGLQLFADEARQLGEALIALADEDPR